MGTRRRQPRSLMAAGSCVAGLPPPIRPCRAVSTRCASAGTWPPTTWSGRCRHGSQRTPGASGWSCSTARWRRSRTICAHSTRLHRCLRFHFPRRRSRTSRSGWKSRSASPSRLDRNGFAGTKRSTGISVAGPWFAGRSCSAPEMPPRWCRPRSRASDAKSWSGISPRAHRSSRSTCVTAPSTVSRYRSGRRWPIWPAPVRRAGTGSIGAVTATPARRALTAARPFVRKRRAWPRSGTTKRKIATSGRSDSRSHASAWPTSTPTSPD